MRSLLALALAVRDSCCRGKEREALDALIAAAVLLRDGPPPEPAPPPEPHHAAAWAQRKADEFRSPVLLLDRQRHNDGSVTPCLAYVVLESAADHWEALPSNHVARFEPLAPDEEEPTP